jgi:hypothetical protein
MEPICGPGRLSNAEVFAAALRGRVTADHELLLQGELDFDPGAAAPAGLIGGIWSLGYQAFEVEVARNFKKLFSGSRQLLGKLDVLRSLL